MLCRAAEAVDGADKEPVDQEDRGQTDQDCQPGKACREHGDKVLLLGPHSVHGDIRHGITQNAALFIINGSTRRNQPSVGLRVGDIRRKSSFRPDKQLPVFLVKGIGAPRRAGVLIRAVDKIKEGVFPVDAGNIEAVHVIDVLNLSELRAEGLKLLGLLQRGKLRDVGVKFRRAPIVAEYRFLRIVEYGHNLIPQLLHPFRVYDRRHRMCDVIGLIFVCTVYQLADKAA